MPDTVVNVASVPHRSPFRYPGGKTWLVPRLRQWLRSLEWKPEFFIEPFTGGGIIALTVAFERLAKNVIIVELDDDVAAVWETMLDKNNEWLAKQIEGFDVTEEAVRALVSSKPKGTRERAFRTIVKNRTFYGGILSGGSAPIRFGENGKGIKSRWYARTIARRIRDIREVKDRISFVHGDGTAIIRWYAKKDRAAFFVDPPYTAAGKKAGNRLYTHCELDHESLFAATASVAGDFLMTYDNADELVDLAAKYGFQSRKIAMKNTHHAVMNELLIGKDLSWTV